MSPIEEKILAVIPEQGSIALPAVQKLLEGSVKATSVAVYLSDMVAAGLLVRPGRGIYARPQQKVVEPPPPDTSDAVIAERKRIAYELAKAVEAAVPHEPMSYIQGFKDGANFVAEQVLGMLLPEPEHGTEDPARQ